MEWPDGSVYIGAFEAGYPHGYELTMTAAGLHYRGPLRGRRGPGRRTAGRIRRLSRRPGGGRPQRRAPCRRQRETASAVSSRAGVPHGEGRLDLARGTTLRGRFSVGRPLGNMEVLYHDGGRCTGPWRGARAGRGTMRWPSGRRYNGLWADAPNDVAGSFSWPDGSRFIGPVEAGLPEGEGWCIDLDATERCSYRAGVRGGVRPQRGVRRHDRRAG